MNNQNMKAGLSLDWIIGFAWGLGKMCRTLSTRYFYISHHDKELLLIISEKIGSTAPQTLKGNKYALWISLQNNLIQRMLSLGWTSRGDKERNFPAGDINQADFIRGYCYTKAAITKPSSGQNDILKIEGAKNVLEAISIYISDVSDITFKNPKKRTVKVPNYGSYYTYELSYQSKSDVPKIIFLLNVHEDKIRSRKFKDYQATNFQ